MGGGERRDEFRQRVIALMRTRRNAVDGRGKAVEQVQMQHLAAEQVQRLHAVGALVDLRDAHVADILLLPIRG